MSYIETNSLSEHILAFLLSARNTRTYLRLLREARIKRYKKQLVATSLSRMKKKGWVTKNESGWSATAKGRSIWTERDRFSMIASPFSKGSPRQTIIAFDIPETKRRERVWLRDQLKAFGYTMLQKSLWRGPGPMPKEFTDRVKELEIASGIKTFVISSK